MIFLTVGNWHKGFFRLVEAVDKLKQQGLIAEEIVAQTGYTKYKPGYFEKSLDFYSAKDFFEYIKAAKLIISHAGIGTISYALKLKKTIIIVPRKAYLGEHFDDHQTATARILEAEHKVLVAYDTRELKQKIQEADLFTPVKTESRNQIVEAVKDFIQQYE
jgi:UDP-N-acetylglucosamine transferase subunit ALG13